MKKIVTYLLLITYFLVFGQSKEPITQSELLKIDTTIKFEHFKYIQVFQFFDKDSLNGKITYSKKVDSNGNILAEYYKDHKTDKFNGYSDILTINEYNEKNQRTSSTTYYETYQKGMVEKTFFYYTDSLLTRAESFDYKKRLRPDVDKGINGSGGCEIEAEDFEETPTWRFKKLIINTYDSLGKKISSSSFFPKILDDKLEYKYDANGKLIEERMLDDDKLLYVKKYEYVGNQTISNLEWINQGWRGTKKIKTFDTTGKLIKESTIQKDKESIDIYQYNAEGNLIRFTAYDNNGQIILTHIYKYQQ